MKEIFLHLMQVYAYTPEQISDMTLEQTLLAYEGEDKSSKVVRCSTIQEAQRVWQEMKNNG